MDPRRRRRCIQESLCAAASRAATMGGRHQGVGGDGEGPPREVEAHQAASRESSWQRASRRRQRQEAAVLVEARGRYRRRGPEPGRRKWTEAEAAKHFDSRYEFENGNPRSGNVFINTEVYKCRKYISDSGLDARIYVRISTVLEILSALEYVRTDLQVCPHLTLQPAPSIVPPPCPPEGNVNLSRFCNELPTPKAPREAPQRHTSGSSRDTSCRDADGFASQH